MIQYLERIFAILFLNTYFINIEYNILYKHYGKIKIMYVYRWVQQYSTIYLVVEIVI